MAMFKASHPSTLGQHTGMQTDTQTHTYACVHACTHTKTSTSASTNTSTNTTAAQIHPWDNKWLVGAIATSMALHFGILYTRWERMGQRLRHE